VHDPRSAQIAQLSGEHAELLPSREALDGLTINNVIGVNLAIAISLGGSAKALAGQLFH
jgi:hypothetical protein